MWPGKPFICAWLVLFEAMCMLGKSRAWPSKRGTNPKLWISKEPRLFILRANRMCLVNVWFILSNWNFVTTAEVKRRPSACFPGEVCWFMLRRRRWPSDATAKGVSHQWPHIWPRCARKERDGIRAGMTCREGVGEKGKGKKASK